MREKRAVILLSGLILALLMATSMALSDSDFGVSKLFEVKVQKLSSVDSTDVLVEAEQFQITNIEYIGFKENLMLVQELNKVPFQLSDEEVIDRMIENELLLQIARNQNIVVTKDEVEVYALQTKEAVNQSSMPEIHAIHAELAKSLNVTLNDYFTHPDVLKNYENTLMIEKAAAQLEKEGKLNEQYTINDMAQELRLKGKSTMHIDFKVLENLK